MQTMHLAHWGAQIAQGLAFTLNPTLNPTPWTLPCDSAEVWGRASRVAARTPALLESSPWAAMCSCLLDRPMHSCCSSGPILGLHTQGMRHSAFSMRHEAQGMRREA